MKYINAKDILPENIFKQLQAYAAGTLLYVPKEGEEKSWGEVSGYRTYLLKRNRMILNFFQYGVSLDEISNVFGLSKGTVQKIVYNKKHREKLTFRPEISSAEEYAEYGLLELQGPLVLMIGNETTGLCQAFKVYCDELLTIPMNEGSCATSFNVSCAASVMMYEVIRQRREKG